MDSMKAALVAFVSLLALISSTTGLTALPADLKPAAQILAAGPISASSPRGDHEFNSRMTNPVTAKLVTKTSMHS